MTDSTPTPDEFDDSQAQNDEGGLPEPEEENVDDVPSP